MENLSRPTCLRIRLTRLENFISHNEAQALQGNFTRCPDLTSLVQ